MQGDLKIGGTRRDADETGLPWEDAPATSHVLSFRFYPRSRFRLLTTSEIHVRFKPKRRKNGMMIPMTEYIFYLPDENAAANIYEKLSTAEHPGEVIHYYLRDSGYRYRQTV